MFASNTITTRLAWCPPRIHHQRVTPQHMMKSDLRSMCDPPTPNSALPQRMSFPRYLREHTWIPYPPSRGPRHLGLRRAPSLGFVTNSEAGFSTALAGKQCRTSFIPSNESVDRLRGPFPFSMGKRTRATSHLSLSSNQVRRDHMCLLTFRCHHTSACSVLNADCTFGVPPHALNRGVRLVGFAGALVPGFRSCWLSNT